MAKNPVERSTKTIGINMKNKMANELEKRARSMNISTSKYCKIILMQGIDSNRPSFEV